MNRKLRWFSLAVILIAICHGAETMAYRFAGEPVVSPPVAECPLLKEAPAPTPFVAAGDVLHDLSGVFREKKVLLENGWAIWNQTQRLLVVHGVMLDQWRVEELSGFREQRRYTKLTVDWIRSEKHEGPPNENDPVFASVTLVDKPGRPSGWSPDVVDSSGKWSFSVHAYTWAGTKDEIDCQLSVTWTGPDGAGSVQGYCGSPIFLTHGQAVPFASWDVGGHGPAWRIDAKGEILIADGIAWRDARLLQKGGKYESCLDSTLESKWLDLRELPVAGDRKLFTIKIQDENIIRSLSGMPDEPDDHDPFADKAPTPRPVLSPDLPVVMVPKDLEDSLYGPMFDLRASLSKFEQDDFVAYDPMTRRVIVWCKDDLAVNSVSQLFMVMNCRGPRQNIQCEAWIAHEAVPDSPWVRIAQLSRFGVKASFELLDAKEQSIASFKAEPGFDYSEALPLTKVDLVYDFLCHLEQADVRSDWHSQSKLTMASGISVLSDATKLSDGRRLKQGLRVRVLPQDAPTPK